MKPNRFIKGAMALLLSISLMPTIPSIAATTTPTTAPTAPDGYSLSYVGRYTQVTPISDDMIAVMVGIKDEGKWGFVNAITGEEILAPTYKATSSSNDSYAEPGKTLRFFDGMARIHTNKGYMVIDKTGKVIVPFGKYSEISNYHNGLALVENKKGTGTGIIDKTGKEIMAPGKYRINGERLWETFDEGLIPVSKVDKKLGEEHSNYIVDGYIDVTGNVAIPFSNMAVGRFSDGLATVYNKTTDKSYFINTKGKKAFKVRDNAEYSNFSDGLSLFTIYDKNDDVAYNGFINQKGKEVLKLSNKYYDMHGYKNGYLLAKSGPNEFNDDGKTLYKENLLDKNGKVIISTKNPDEGLVDPSNGLVAKYIETDIQSNIYGMIYYGVRNFAVYNLSTGKSIVPVDKYVVQLCGVNLYANDNFYQGGVFPDGMVKVYVPGKEDGTYDSVGFINKDGKEVVPQGKYYSVDYYSEGKCAIKDMDTILSGYIDTKGKEIIKPQFDQAGPFVNGKALVGMYTGENIDGNEDAPLFDWYVLSENPDPALDKYTVKFNTLGGSDTASLTNQQSGLIIKPDTPVRKGYGFIGWYKNKGCTQSWDFTADKIKADTTLYAKWKKI